MLEFEINSLNHFLHKMKLYNPNLSQVKLNPISELQKMRVQYLNQTKNLVPTALDASYNYTQFNTATQTDLFDVSSQIYQLTKHQIMYTNLKAPKQEKGVSAKPQMYNQATNAYMPAQESVETQTEHEK